MHAQRETDRPPLFFCPAHHNTSTSPPHFTSHRLRHRDARVADLEAALASTRAELADAKSALEATGGSAAGGPHQALHPDAPDPGAAAAAALAAKTLEAVALRRALATARSAADPHIAQARTLLLDPATAAEFERLRSCAEASTREAAGLRERVAGLTAALATAAAGGAGGPAVEAVAALADKVEALQAENEELAAEASDGRVGALERSAAAGRALLDAARRGEAAAAARAAAAEAALAAARGGMGAGEAAALDRKSVV